MVERFLTLRREFDEAMRNFVLGVQWKKKTFQEHYAEKTCTSVSEIIQDEKIDWWSAILLKTIW